MRCTQGYLAKRVPVYSGAGAAALRPDPRAVCRHGGCIPVRTCAAWHVRLGGPPPALPGRSRTVPCLAGLAASLRGPAGPEEAMPVNGRPRPGPGKRIPPGDGVCTGWRSGSRQPFDKTAHSALGSSHKQQSSDGFPPASAIVHGTPAPVVSPAGLAACRKKNASPQKTVSKA